MLLWLLPTLVRYQLYGNYTLLLPTLGCYQLYASFTLILFTVPDSTLSYWFYSDYLIQFDSYLPIRFNSRCTIVLIRVTVESHAIEYHICQIVLQIIQHWNNGIFQVSENSNWFWPRTLSIFWEKNKEGDIWKQNIPHSLPYIHVLTIYTRSPIICLSTTDVYTWNLASKSTWVFSLQLAIYWAFTPPIGMSSIPDNIQRLNTDVQPYMGIDCSQ